MSGVRHVEGDESFPRELAKAGNRLVVVDFTASWCGPCKRIAPVFAELAAKYSHNLFLKVDVDECPQTANDNKVQAMPTFMFFKNGQKIDSIRGADPEALESKVRELGGDKPKVEAFTGQGRTLGGSGGGPSLPPPWERPSATGSASSSTAPAPKPTSAAENGDAGAAAPAGVTLVPMLMEMGFSKQKCIRAVTVTKTTDIQVALEWLFEHADEPDELVVTDEDVVMADVIASSKNTNSNAATGAAAVAPSVSTDTGAAGGVAEGGAAGGGAEAGAAGGGAAGGAAAGLEKEEGEMEAGGQEAEEAKATSLKCDDCGKLFRSAEFAEMHAVKTQHSNFSESTEEIAPLTAEEKAAKLKEIESKMHARRMEREAKEKEEAIAREKLRRKQGQEMVAAKAAQDEAEMKKIAEQRRLEKLEERAAKQRVLDQIARDRAEREAKFSKKPEAAAAPTPAPAAAPAPVAKKDYTECRLQIRLPDGSALTNQFGVNEELAAVRLYVDLNRKDGRSAVPFTFMTTFPKKVFSEADMRTSLQGLGLVPSAVLIVTKPS